MPFLAKEKAWCARLLPKSSLSQFLSQRTASIGNNSLPSTSHYNASQDYQHAESSLWTLATFPFRTHDKLPEQTVHSLPVGARLVPN